MKTFGKAVAIWTPVWAMLLVIAFFMSQGEPICEGPLILGVGDSNPPQCNTPLFHLPQFAISLFGAGMIPLTIGVAAVLATRKLRRRG